MTLDHITRSGRGDVLQIHRGAPARGGRGSPALRGGSLLVALLVGGTAFPAVAWGQAAGRRVDPASVIGHGVSRGDMLGGSAAGASSSPLDAVVAEALRNNLGLAQETLAVDRAEAGVAEARGRFLPSVSLESRYSEQSGTLDLGDFVNPANAALNALIGESRFPTDLNVTVPFRHESRLRLVQPLYDPRVVAGHARARSVHAAQALGRSGAARRLAAEAQTAYLTVAATRSARRTWEATLDLVRENERVAERLVGAGRATPDAVYRARAERSDVEQRLAEARETEDAAARAFNQMLRRPLDQPVDALPDSLVRFEIAFTEDEAVASALARREELAGTGARIRAAEAEVRLATASFLPSIAVAVDYGFQGADLSFDRDQDFAVASIVASWDVFGGGSHRARRGAAMAETARLRLGEQELEDRIRLDVRQAWGAAAVARDAIGTADAGLAAARRTFELVRRRYEEGLASQVELVDARTALTSAELNRVNTIYRYAIRYVDLERAAALRDIDPDPVN